MTAHNFCSIPLYDGLAPAIFWALYWGRGYNALCVLGRVMGDRGHNGHPPPIHLPPSAELTTPLVACLHHTRFITHRNNSYTHDDLQGPWATSQIAKAYHHQSENGILRPHKGFMGPQLFGLYPNGLFTFGLYSHLDYRHLDYL